MTLQPIVTVEEDQLRVVLELPPLELIPRGEVLLPVMEGTRSRASEPGHPILPVVTFNLLLPEGRRAASVHVSGAVQPIPGRFALAWGQKPRRISGPEEEWVDKDLAVYGSDALYPARAAVLLGEGRAHGFRVVTLELHPVQVRPASGALSRFASIDVVIELETAERTATVTPLRAARRSLLRRLSRTVVNPETALGYGFMGAAFGRQERTHGVDDSGAEEGVDEETLPYLIVTSEALRPAFETLLAHRRAIGIDGEVLTMDDVLAGYSGRDDAERLREAIRDYYETRGTEFVLLGGDDVDDDGASVVPVRYCKPYDNMTSDYYFGALDGDWDTDGDGTMCEGEEVDYFSEVHIGRATVDTLAEAETWVAKLIAYEDGLSEERRRDLVAMGEKLDDSTYGDDAMEQTLGLIPLEEYDVERLYARPETFNATNVIRSLNRGPHLTNHLGHAGSNYVMGIGTGDVDNLINESPFFSYSQGCYAGAFDQGVSGNDEAISEHFLTADHAAHAVIMNSRYGWYCVGSPFCLSQVLDHEFHDALFTEGLTRLGEANDDARADYAGEAQGNHTARYCFLETNLHGDPATRVDLARAQLEIESYRIIENDPAYGNADTGADPGETVQIAVTLRNHGTSAASGIEARLLTSAPGTTVRDNWVAFPAIAAGEAAENLAPHFTVHLGESCGAKPALRLEVRHGEGQVDVSAFGIAVGDQIDTEVFADDFEADEGWQVGGDARSGGFVRGDPHEVIHDFVGPMQPEDDFTPDDGDTCWITGNPTPGPGFDPVTGDVDRGSAYIESPTFDGSGEGRLLTTFCRWFHRTRVQPLDQGWYRARVSNDDGATWHDLERVELNLSAWKAPEIDISAIVPPSSTMRLRFEAYETIRQPGDPLVELLVDDVSIYRRVLVCEDFFADETQSPNEVGPTLRLERRSASLRLSWSAPAEDPTHDAARHYVVYRSEAPDGGFTSVGEPTRTEWHDWSGGQAAYGNRFYVVSAANAAGESGEAPLP